MDPNLVFSIFDDPLPSLIAGLTMGIIVMLFFDYLWFSLCIEVIVCKKVTCPEKRISATVGFLTQVVDSGLPVKNFSEPSNAISERLKILSSNFQEVTR